MNGIPFAYWGAGNCTDFMPATQSLQVYYNVNQPSCYTIGSNTLYNIAPNFTQYTGSTTAQYDVVESALDCRSNSITAYYPFAMYGDLIPKTIMFRAKLDSASEQYFLFRNTLNANEGARAFSANPSNGGGLGFQRGVFDCRNILPTSSVAGFNSQFVTIAIQTNGNGLGSYYIQDDGYNTAYSVNSAPISCTTINDYDVIMENAGFIQSWAVWNKSLTPLEMRSASIALGCNALYDPFINPQDDTLPTNGLVAFLSCDSLTGSTWFDKSGNSNNATVYGPSTNPIQNGVWFNGNTYSSQSMNYLQFPNPLTATPSSSATIIFQGQYDLISTPNRYTFSKGWNRFAQASGSYGWDLIYNSIPNLAQLNFRAVSPLDTLITTGYTSGSYKMIALTVESGSVANLDYISPKNYESAIENSINWGASGSSNFSGSGLANSIPLTFGKGDISTNCDTYNLRATTGNTRYYDYIDCNGVSQNIGVGGSNTVAVSVYPSTVPSYQGSTSNNTIAPLITYVGSNNGGTPSPTPTFYPVINNGADPLPFKGQISNILIYNRVLSAPELYSIYNNLENNTLCVGSIPPSPLPSLFTNNPLASSIVLWNNKTSLSSSIWYDISGNGNHGTVYGTPITESGSLGYAFNGSNNYVGYRNNITSSVNTQWTMQFYGSLYNDNITRDLWAKGAAGVGNGWQINWKPTANPTGSAFFQSNAGKLAYNYTSSVKVLVTITEDSVANQTKLYVNENYITASAGWEAFNENSFIGLTFGKVQWLHVSDSGSFKGTVSDLLIYDKVLSATEVSQSYSYLSSI